MTKGVADLAKALAEGQSPEDLLASLRPKAERSVLRRCALTPTFDRSLFESVLARGDSTPGFDAVIDTPEVERVPRRAGVYRVRAAARSELWRSWWPDGPPAERGALPDELSEVAEALAVHHDSQGDMVALLADLVAVNPTEAARLFRSEYAKADQAFDLPLCQDLVAVLAAPQRRFLLTSELNELQADHAAYLGARSLWAAEYYQTARYLERSGAIEAYERLIQGPLPRSLNLHAPSGRGKTIQLRWLIARRLVPRLDEDGELAAFIPCAKVDFDLIDPIRTTHYPWLLLLEFAAQLNHQFPEGPFNELLEKHGWLTPLLRRNPDDQKRVDAASRRLRGANPEAVRMQVTKGFRRKLAEEARGRPVMLVFDTVEEIHLRPEGNLQALMELVRNLLDDVPSARLIVAGRYPIAEILQHVRTELPEMIDAPVEPFTTEEATSYLEEIRAVGTPEQREAIVEQAGGDPFTLALLADIVAERPHLSPHELRRHPADIIRLIRRIVNRIDEDGVRWVLRYGVIPRSLSLPFLESVMWPHLRDGMRGIGVLDTPDDDELVADDDVKPFATDEEPPPPEELWQQLRRYAGSTSWVYEVPGTDEETLRLRSEVVVPMRRIIRDKPIYPRLHEDAAEYFEQKARDEPEGWERWTREAIYHRFQLEGSNAEPYWRRILGEIGYDDSTRREAIAAELLEPDYVERDVPVTFTADRPMITLDAMIEAHFERACALSELVRDAGGPPDDIRWGDIERSRDAIQRAQMEAGREVVSKAGIGYIDAGLALRFNDLERAARQIDDALSAAETPVELARLRMLLGDVQLATRDPRTPATLRSALAAVRRLRDSHRWQATIRRDIVTAELALDRLREADEDQRQALERAPSAGERSRLSVLGAEIAMRAGRYELAAATACEAVSERNQARAWQLRVTALLALRDAPAAAAAGEDAAMRSAPDSGTTVSVTASPETACAAELQGLTAGVLMDFELAFDSLERARRLWNSEGDVDAVARCSLEAALLKMRGAGDLNVAEHHLAEAREVGPPVLEETWLQVALAEVELHARQGDAATASALLGALLEEIAAAGDPPRLTVPAAVAALAWGGDDMHQPVLQRLVAACRRIEPASARVALLTGLREVARVHGDLEPLHELRRLVRTSRDTRLTKLDRAVQQLTIAELDRLRGNEKGARTQLRAARDVLSESSSSVFWLREWAAAAGRLDQRVDLWPSSEQQEQFLTEFSDRPMLCAAFLIERAEAEVKAAPAQALQRLGRADELLKATKDVQTQWSARSQLVRGEVEERLDPSGDFGMGALLIGSAAAGLLHLGQKMLRRRLHKADLEPLSAFQGEHPRVRVAATLDVATLGGALDVSTRVPLASGEQSTQHVMTPSPLMAALLGMSPSIREAAFEPLLAGWLAEPESLPQELAATLPAELDALASDPRSYALLELGDRRLQALPWEMARQAGRSAPLPLVRTGTPTAETRDVVVFTQVALTRLGHLEAPIDGVYGEITTEAMRRYQAAAGLPADGTPREAVIERLQHDVAAAGVRREGEVVILVQPSATRQIWGTRGKASMGLDVEWLYTGAGFTVARVENPTIDAIQATTHGVLRSGLVPAILHLSGGLRELGGGIAFSFLAGEWHLEALSGEHVSDELPVTALDHVLEAFPRDAFRPLVILDVDRPRGLAETATSLLLRNVYAADLFALGRCPAVIAMGLVPGTEADPYSALVNGLAGGASLVETCAAIRSLDSPGSSPLHMHAALSGMALFTHLPWLRMRLS